MKLTAWAEGVGANWVGFGGLEEVGRLVGIPSHMEVLAIVPFGYPAVSVGRGKKNRKPRAIRATLRLIWCRSSTPRPPRWIPFSAPNAFGYSIGYSRREAPRPSTTIHGETRVRRRFSVTGCSLPSVVVGPFGYRIGCRNSGHFSRSPVRVERRARGEQVRARNTIEPADVAHWDPSPCSSQLQRSKHPA